MSERLDVELVNRGLVESRERAKAYIMEGVVYVDGQKAMKAGDKVKDGMQIEVRGTPIPYVSRGGLKLEKAVSAFSLDLTDKICVDVGASTGGFTDCMLQNGAKKVYAIDVGYGQLAWKLRTDDRVVNIERTNIRYLDLALLQEPIDFSSIDVAFISLKLVLPVVFSFLRDGGQVVALVKPQFEAGREEVGKKGVVRDAAVHQNVIHKTVDAALELGFSVLRLDVSPIRGPEGNLEFLLLLEKCGQANCAVTTEMIAQTVQLAHQEL